MTRFLIYFVLIILLTIFLWGNMDNKASLNIMGSEIFQNVPVLIIILSSMFIGMVMMLPFMYLNKMRNSKKLKTELDSEDGIEMTNSMDSSKPGADEISPDQNGNS